MRRILSECVLTTFAVLKYSKGNTTACCIQNQAKRLLKIPVRTFKGLLCFFTEISRVLDMRVR
ncbi:protein of unknown function [Paenibacillus alvei]|uniref:Uncharacterized protein n=1 Tax=Paenibacillus alvei TaxID=44250 RepID=A0A383R7X0_PAEAL|nr:protein of unknown function [Paenibacillus alvei]